MGDGSVASSATRHARTDVNVIPESERDTAAPKARSVSADQKGAALLDHWVTTSTTSRTLPPITALLAAPAVVATAPRSCGTPTPTTPVGPPEQFKATDQDAIRQWLDPAYAERRQAEKLAAQMRAEVAKLVVEDQVRNLVVHAPEAVKQVAVLGPVVIPIAEVTHDVAMLTPIVSELVAGAEAVTGNGLFGLGEKLSDEERVVNGLIAATLVAGPILESGARGARVIVEVARRTGRSTEQIITALKAARALKKDEAVLREALALRKAGATLEPHHEAALLRAGEATTEVLGGSVGAARRYRFEPNPKHKPMKVGNVSAAPINGQSALDHSVQIKPKVSGRVGVDYDTNQIVVFREHETGNGVFHGYVNEWNELTTEQQNALSRSGLTNRRGKILRGDQ